MISEITVHIDDICNLESLNKLLKQSIPNKCKHYEFQCSYTLVISEVVDMSLLTDLIYLLYHEGKTFTGRIGIERDIDTVIAYTLTD